MEKNFVRKLILIVITLVGFVAMPCDAKVSKWGSQELNKNEKTKDRVLGSKWSKRESVAVNQAEKDGIVYTCYKSGFASCHVESSKKKTMIQATILPKIIIDGQNCVVDIIEKDGFRDCKRLINLTIPATIKHVGARAFFNNGDLESITCLSNNVTFDVVDYKWATDCGPFFNCRKIKTVKWVTATIPYFAFDAFSGNVNCPYSKILEEAARSTGVSNPSYNQASRHSSSADVISFKEFAEKKITDVYNRWQRKKEYETRGQYAERTSAEKREQMKRKLFDEARNEYINLYAPVSLEGTIVEYDTDYKVYTIEVPSIGNIYAQVPIADRTLFEDNWTGVQIVPVYNIIDNKLVVVSCEYNVGGKTFISPKIYDKEEGDNYSDMAFEARQIDLEDLFDDNDSDNLSSGNASGKTAQSCAVNTAPFTGIHNPDTFALIVGNENYKYVEPVKFAVDDAVTFARYCKNTLGIPSQNILAVQDVTKGELRRTIREIQGIFEDDGQSKSLIVYYAGHGIPDTKNADSMILPVDASASDTESCYSLQTLYNQLGELNANSIVIYMDACFIGSARGGGKLLADRAGVDFIRSQVEPRGNMIVLSATSASDTALPYTSMGHGIFTYFLLDKLQQSKGNLTLGELAEYVTLKVKSQSQAKAGKRQIPSISVSSTFTGDWKSIPVTLMK